eukprot:Gb_30784 [translate_table: standard]
MLGASRIPTPSQLKIDGSFNCQRQAWSQFINRALINAPAVRPPILAFPLKEPSTALTNMPAFNQNANTSTESTANEVHHQHPQNNNNGREAPEPGSPAMPEAVDNGFSNSQAKEGDIAGSMLGARGGPLFMPGLISPVTSAREFEASVTEQLTVSVFPMLSHWF